MIDTVIPHPDRRVAAHFSPRPASGIHFPPRDALARRAVRSFFAECRDALKNERPGRRTVEFEPEVSRPPAGNINAGVEVRHDGVPLLFPNSRTPHLRP